jgi:hypothetical protein
VVMMLVVPSMMAKHMRGMQMTVTIWTKCFESLDQKYYKETREV